MAERKVIKAQSGYQEAFLSSPADIVIGGGAAGAGKTLGLLLDPLRYIHINGFGAVIFRRTTPQITNEGSLWDTSLDLYGSIGGDPKVTRLQWNFQGRSRIRFHHLEHENNKFDHQGGQYPYIGFDELTQFSKTQFLYLLSRNRSPVAQVKPCIRATCNPDPDSWVAEFLEWWIDQNTGFPIQERVGKLRYLINDAGTFVWGDSVQEVIDKCPHIFSNPDLKDMKPEDLVKSVTFIPGSVYENKLLLQNNPEYLANLLALPEEEQMRLLRGNWKVRQDGSSLFDFQRINDLFTNFVDESKERYITCDVARFGDDLAVIATWIGWKVVRWEIFTKSKTTEITQAIEQERQRMKIPKSSVVVDSGGVGGGVADEGDYIGFNSGAKAENDEFYKNLKAQCYYKFADKVNAAEVQLVTQNIIIDGVPAQEIRIGDSLEPVTKLIKADLRAVKKKNLDRDGKKEINSKEEQKNILGGRSPDFGDTLMQRVFFDLKSASIKASDVAFV